MYFTSEFYTVTAGGRLKLKKQFHVDIIQILKSLWEPTLLLAKPVQSSHCKRLSLRRTAE